MFPRVWHSVAPWVLSVPLHRRRTVGNCCFPWAQSDSAVEYTREALEVKRCRLWRNTAQTHPWQMARLVETSIPIQIRGAYSYKDLQHRGSIYAFCMNDLNTNAMCIIQLFFLIQKAFFNNLKMTIFNVNMQMQQSTSILRTCLLYSVCTKKSIRDHQYNSNNEGPINHWTFNASLKGKPVDMILLLTRLMQQLISLLLQSQKI